MSLGWELLYRVEPGLYERLVAGERVHRGIVNWLPRAEVAVDAGAGTGRMTRDLVERCRRVVAVEPAAPMRERLHRRVPAAYVVAGFFEALPLRDGVADLVVACSSFTSEHGHGGEAGLREMERVAKRGGAVVIVWPQDTGWLEARGFQTVTFTGAMSVDFATPHEAVELCRVFYPHAADEVARRGVRDVRYELLGIGAPRTMCWKLA